MKRAVFTLLAVWFALALAASVAGWLRNVPSPILLLGGFVLACAGYFAVYRYSPRFRRFVLDQDPRQVTMLQASRITGFIFFIAYLRGDLPGIFAITTGASDMTIGATALVVSRLVSKNVVPRGRFPLWHLLGIAALMIDGGLGVLTSPTPLGVLATGVTSQAMSDFPLSLVPTFLGPVVLILHLAALAIARQRRQVASALPDLFAQSLRNA